MIEEVPEGQNPEDFVMPPPQPRPLTEIEKINEEVADRINQEALANPQSPYAGKFVGIVSGQVVIVADTLTEVARTLRQHGTDSANAFIIEASRDYSVEEYIWELF